MMTTAKRIQKAWELGVAFGKGRAWARSQALAQDANKWITVHPNGEDNTGRPVLIDEKSGIVKAGMGNKFNGEHISKTAKNAREKIDMSNPERIDKDHILQNRDRSGKGSIIQMQAIAKNPDYDRLGVGKDFGSGAPVIAYGSISDRQLGSVTRAVMSDGQKYKVQYAVVEAGTVLTSNNFDGSSNEEYYSDDPTKPRAIAGNGRLTALREAYNMGTTDDYRNEMIADRTHGISRKVIQNMKNPVLVRIMQTKDVTPDIGDRSNQQQGLSMTAVERANNDSHRVDFKEMEFDDDGYPTRDALNLFIQKMPLSEKGALIDVDGTPTRQAVERLRDAVFAAAYENDSLTRLVTQHMDPDSRVIIGALGKVAHKMNQLKGMGNGYDIRDLVAQAAERAVNARRTGRNLHDESNQTSFIGSQENNDASAIIVKIFAENARSSHGIAKVLSKVVDNIVRENEQGDFDLFGEREKADRVDLIRNALNQDSVPREEDTSNPYRRMSPEAERWWRQKGGKFLQSIIDDNMDKELAAELRAISKKYPKP